MTATVHTAKTLEAAEKCAADDLKNAEKALARAKAMFALVTAIREEQTAADACGKCEVFNADLDAAHSKAIEKTKRAMKRRDVAYAD
jgi:hypothetical protein